MKFFNQHWSDISNKCSCNIYESATGISPYTIVTDWLFSNETREEFSENPDCIKHTTAEKSKIRQERLDIFLPHLEKEYPTFLKLARKQNLILKLIKFNDILAIIIFLALSYYSTKFFIFLAPFISKILISISSSHKSLINIIVYGICFLLIPFSYFLSWRIGDRFPYILTYPSILLLQDDDFKKNVRLSKHYHIRSFFKSTPYTIAFLIANGFIDSRDFCPPSESRYYWKGWYQFVVPYKEIKKLSFNEFINYIKLRVEPTFKSYHRIHQYVNAPKNVETKALHAIFFYLNEEDLQNTSKLRSKTLKSAPFARDIECYIKPKEPCRDEYGNIIYERKNNTERYIPQVHTRSQQKYTNKTTPQKSSPKPKKPSSYDKMLDEWKEQIIISTLLENNKKK